MSTDLIPTRKFKLPNQQNGQVYLTSHRICYVDKEAPRKHSVALDLKAIERYEFYVSASSPSGLRHFFFQHTC